MTWCAPTRLRMLPCFAVSAFAQMSGTPASDRASTVSRLDSTFEPIATTAWSNCPTPSCRSTSSSEQSAWTTWMSWSAQIATSRESCSIARTSTPSWTRVEATAVPNRPRPATRTDPVSCLLLADNGALLGQAVVMVLGPQCQRGGNRDRADACHEHEPHQGQLRGRRQSRRDAGGQTHGRERGDCLEPDNIRGQVGGEQQCQGADGD